MLCDGSDDAHPPLTARAGRQVGREDPAQKLSPDDPVTPPLRLGWLILLLSLAALATVLLDLGHNGWAQASIGRENAMISYEIGPWPWHEGCQTLEELERGQQQVRGTIFPRAFELKGDAAVIEQT